LGFVGNEIMRTDSEKIAVALRVRGLETRADYYPLIDL
jgi:hypothetical protein